jgi:hypothetical protein
VTKHETFRLFSYDVFVSAAGTSSSLVQISPIDGVKAGSEPWIVLGEDDRRLTDLFRSGKLLVSIFAANRKGRCSHPLTVLVTVGKKCVL